MTGLSYHERIRQKLTTHFSPTQLEIKDDSARHAGHAGAQAGGETHFSIVVTSAAFRGLSPVARHRLVYDVLAEELKERVHALQLELKEA